MDSNTYGFSYRSQIGSYSNYVTFINCVANNSAQSGFLGDDSIKNSHLVSCTARGCGTRGFEDCCNVSACFVDGMNETATDGFYGCYNLSSCQAVDCKDSAYQNCERLSACSAVGNATTSAYGFRDCNYLSACTASDCVTDNWSGCGHITASNNTL